MSLTVPSQAGAQGRQFHGSASSLVEAVSDPKPHSRQTGEGKAEGSKEALREEQRREDLVLSQVEWVSSLLARKTLTPRAY